MPCNAIQTGNEFLSATLAHIDCQARTIGAYGYGALAETGSPVAIALTGLLVIFIALFGIRLLLGYPMAGRDLVGDALKVGIVLTLASSWPAWRTLGYDLVLDGPAEIASSIGAASGLPGSRKDMIQRLQAADNAIVVMTVFGSGRLTGDVAVGSDIGDSPRGVALSDQFALGTGRTLFLSTTIGSVALVRLGAGVLLAIAPLIAGLLLFPATASIFFGWLRALVFCALGNILLLVAQGAELALLYPWLSDVLQQREARVFTPSAPTELLVLTLGFAVLTAGLLLLTARLAFLPAGLGGVVRDHRDDREGAVIRVRPDNNAGSVRGEPASSRAFLISEAVSTAMRREEGSSAPQRLIAGPAAARPSADTPSSTSPTRGPDRTEALGSTFRRGRRRSSAAAQRRDAQT